MIEHRQTISTDMSDNINVLKMENYRHFKWLLTCMYGDVNL